MNGPGGSFVTDQYVLAAHGRAEKPFAFIFCSDKPFTEVSNARIPSIVEAWVMCLTLFVFTTFSASLTATWRRSRSRN